MRRKLDRRECKLILFAHMLLPNHLPNGNARLHLVRMRHNGGLVPACTASEIILEDAQTGYYLFPLLGWLVENAPICVICKKTVYIEGLLVEKENPVPVTRGSEKDATGREHAARRNLLGDKPGGRQ